MEKKNNAHITIGGKDYCVSGNEDSEYFFRIADYINQKQSEVRANVGRTIINDSESHVLMLINLADDYLKLMDAQEAFKEEIHSRSREIAILKNEVNSLRAKLDAAQKDNQVLLEKLKQSSKE